MSNGKRIDYQIIARNRKCSEHGKMKGPYCSKCGKATEKVEFLSKKTDKWLKITAVLVPFTLLSIWSITSMVGCSNHSMVERESFLVRMGEWGTAYRMIDRQGNDNEKLIILQAFAKNATKKLKQDQVELLLSPFFAAEQKSKATVLLVPFVEK